MADKKTITINGATYDSKSDAIRALLVDGMKKSEIAKITESHYSFVVTVEHKMLADSTPEAEAARQAKEEAKAAKTATEEAAAKEKAEKKAARDKERAEKKAATEAEKAKKKAARDAVKADKQAKLKKAATIAAGKTKSNKKSAAIDENDVYVDDSEIEAIEAALANDALIPEDIAADMAEEGLFDDEGSID